MHGKGKYIYSDGSIYDGQWIDSKMHGKGIYIYPNQDRYEGEFVDDLKNVSEPGVTACCSSGCSYRHAGGSGRRLGMRARG